jgi:hypothetical protein
MTLAPPVQANRAHALFERAFVETLAQSNLSRDDAAYAMRHGDCYQCEEFHRLLSQLVAQELANVDSGLRAVYRFDPALGSGEDSLPRTFPSESSAIDLLVWTEHKNESLQQCASALELAFEDERAEWICDKAVEWCHTLNIVIVDDEQVRTRQGYAALIDSLWVRPTRVWQRGLV